MRDSNPSPCPQAIYELYLGESQFFLAYNYNLTIIILSILKALEERLERPGPPSQWQSALRNKWRSEVVPPLFLHASFCGSLTAVKYFISNGYKPTMMYVHMYEFKYVNSPVLYL